MEGFFCDEKRSIMVVFVIETLELRFYYFKGIYYTNGNTNYPAVSMIVTKWSIKNHVKPFFKEILF